MRELERELRELGGAIAGPATPDIAARVTAQLSEDRLAPPRRRRIVIALAVGVVLLVGTSASPARTAILRFFGIGAVRIELVDRLPVVEPTAPLAAGAEIPPTAAPFPLLRSDLLGTPDHVYASGDVVTLLYGPPDRIRLLVTEIGSTELSPALAKKLVVGSTGVELVQLEGIRDPALWIEGKPHVVVFPAAPARLARNTLVWTQDGRTLRIEGGLTKNDAVRVAESFR
jgi:hypothetical protein